ncbi:11869_t:CDS:2, partial [Cetraspora pellucida]
MKYSEQLLSYFKENNMKYFDYSQHKNRKFIGKGGFAIVYSAILEGEERALKSLNNSFRFNDKEFKQFSREVEGIYKISWTELIQVAKDITSGLKHLHDKHIIHLDLHSKNILINDGRALITDFGISTISTQVNVTIASSSDIPAYIEPHQVIRVDPKEPSEKAHYRQERVELLNGNLVIDCPDDEILLSRTLDGIMENITHLCSLKDSPTWGDDAWKKVVVCIISDGRNNINEHVLAYFTALEAHIYEYTTFISIKHFKNSVEMKVNEGMVPIQIVFCLTEQSKRGVDSSQWFFSAFCPILVPQICVFIDVGVKPGYGSLYNLWNAFSVNPNVAGVCGNIDLIKGRNWIKFLNPIAGAQ